MKRRVGILGAALYTGHGVTKDFSALATTLPEGAPRERLRTLLGERTPRRLDRLSELALVAASEAMLAAGQGLHALTHEASLRAGVFFATEHGNLSGTIAFLQRLSEKGPRLASPIDFPNLVMSAPAGALSIQFGFRGELLTYNHGEFSGVHALAAAYDAIASGRLDLALCVGAEEMSAARQVFLRHDALRPLGEGAGALLLGSGDGEIELGGAFLARGDLALAAAAARLAPGQSVEFIGAAPSGTTPKQLAPFIGYLDAHGILDAAWAFHLLQAGKGPRYIVAAADFSQAAAAYLHR